MGAAVRLAALKNRILRPVMAQFFTSHLTIVSTEIEKPISTYFDADRQCERCQAAGTRRGFGRIEDLLYRAFVFNNLFGDATGPGRTPAEAPRNTLATLSASASLGAGSLRDISAS
jgi:hypothetical protein